MSDRSDLVSWWLGKLTKLNPAAGRGQRQGKAPHKPLLLLCLFDMAEAGELTQRRFTRTAGLVLRFKEYGGLVSDRWPTRLDLQLPFFHLTTQRFWKPFTQEETEARSPETCVACDLAEEFFDLLGDPDFRLKARLLLVERYFESREQVALLESMGLGLDGMEPLQQQALQLNEDAEAAARRKGRSARFSIKVVSQYRFTCALTGLCCVTTDGSTVVDAAHIDPWASSGNDDPRNGLALCKNAHWMFDEGLWSVGPDHRIVVATHRFTENGPEDLGLQPRAGHSLQFAPGTALRPDPRCLTQHREYHRF